jgi:uncharacterized SAM-binding protein YcdF (DUF218 family)
MAGLVCTGRPVANVTERAKLQPSWGWTGRAGELGVNTAHDATSRSDRGRFPRGVLVGVLLVVGSVMFINNTPVADWAVAPLLTADSEGPADAIVVLGAGVIGNCTPNHSGVWRVLLGVRLWREKRAPFMLFTGGTGQPACPVAAAMARLATELGVPESSIRLETASRNTRENADASAPLLRSLGVRRVLLVTDRLHMRRGEGVFARQGFKVARASVPIYEGHSDNVSMLRAGSREYTALTYYRLRGWLGASAREDTSRIDATDAPVASKDLAAEAGVPIVNRGARGQQYFELVARFESNVAPRLPRAAIISGAMNELGRTSTRRIQSAQRMEEGRHISETRHAALTPHASPVLNKRPLKGPESR